jgi:hypothetical protein
MRRQVLNAAIGTRTRMWRRGLAPGSLPQLTQNGGELGFSYASMAPIELGPRTRMHIECRVGPGSQFDLAISWVTERYVAREASFEILGPHRPNLLFRRERIECSCTSPGTKVWFDDTGRHPSVRHHAAVFGLGGGGRTQLPDGRDRARPSSRAGTAAHKRRPGRDFPYIFSVPHGRYVLCRDLSTEVVTLRYNVVPRSDFVNYLKGVGKGDRSALVADIGPRPSL